MAKRRAGDVTHFKSCLRMLLALAAELTKQIAVGGDGLYEIHAACISSSGLWQPRPLTWSPAYSH